MVWWRSGSRAVITSRCELYARWWEAQSPDKRGAEVLSPPNVSQKLYAHVKRHNMIISASEARTHFLIIPTPSTPFL